MTNTPLAASIILVQGTSWVGRSIQAATLSRYSHVALVVRPPISTPSMHSVVLRPNAANDPFGRTFEADTGGVLSRPLHNYPWRYVEYGIHGMTDERAAKLARWCTEQLGRPYDYGKVIGLTLEHFLHLTGVRSILDSKRAFYCTEFLWEALAAAGYDVDEWRRIWLPRDVPCVPLFYRLPRELVGGAA